MALGGNPGSALAAYGKRKEQIERWQRSDTAKQPTEIKDRPKRVNFEDKCIFLAASSAGEKNKVARMLRDGYNINEVDGDGITALHQACIEDNIEMVEFLLDHGADVNISDNEGWTPLHAVASCNFTSIAKVLLEHGANSAALNNDCSLPIDICKNDDIKDLLRADLASKAIDVGAARKAEEAAMIEHVKEWLVNGYCEIPHSTTGATAMHVAACKGYIKVLDKLIKAGADINAVDGDGWTPLHAAAHWGQLEACRVLLEAECDTSIANNCDQDAVEVADLSVVSLLEPYKKPRKRDATVVKYLPLPPPPKKKALKSRSMFDERITTNINLSPKKDVPSNKPTATNTTTSLLKADKDEEEHGEAEDTVSDLPSSSLDQIPVDSSHPTSPPLPCPDTATLSSLHSTKSDDDNTQTPDGVTLRRHQRDKTFTRNLNSDVFLKTKDAASAGFGENRRKLGEGDKVSSSLPSLSSSNVATGSSSVATSTKTDYLKTNDGGASGDTEEGVPAWRRGGSLRTRTTQPTTSTLPEEDQATTGDKAAVRRTKSEVSPEVSLRRAYSFESDTKFYFRLHEARERLRAIEAVSAAMNANLPDIYSLGGKEGKVKDVPATPPPTAKEPESVTSTAPKVKPTPVIFTPVTTLTTPTVPTLTTPTVPTTLQRAHTVPAPSTSSQGQGPDLTPRARRKYIEEAESERLFNNATNPASPDYNPEIVLRRRDSDTNVRTARPTTISTTSPTTATRPLPGHPFLRRSFVPPARDEESETQRKAHAKRVRETRRSTQGVTLEELKSAEQYVKAQQSTDSTVPDTIQESASASSPTTVPVSSSSHAAPGNVTSTGMLRKEDDSLERRPSWRLRVDDTDPSKFSLEDLRSTGTTATHSQSAESKSRLESPATSDPKYSPVIRTRRHELRNSRPPRPPEEEDTNLVKEESAEAKTGAQGVIAKKKKPKRRSTGVLNYSSTWTDDLDGPQTLSDTESSRRGSDDGGASTGQDSPKSENGIAGKVNYKKLYEETLKENQQLKGKVSTLEEEVNQLKISLERMSISTRLGGDAVDMREKRALELKFQEMEEELKKARTLQSDNKKLKDENGALIRVISKLSK